MIIDRDTLVRMDLPKIDLSGCHTTTSLMDYLHIAMTIRTYAQEHYDSDLLYVCNTDFLDYPKIENEDNYYRFVGLTEDAVTSCVDEENNSERVFAAYVGLTYWVAKSLGLNPATASEDFHYEVSLGFIKEKLEITGDLVDDGDSIFRRIHNTLRIEWLTRIIRQIEDTIERRKVFNYTPSLDLSGITGCEVEKMQENIMTYMRADVGGFLCYGAFSKVRDQVDEAIASHFFGGFVHLKHIAKAVQNNAGLSGAIRLLDFISPCPVLEYAEPNHQTRTKLLYEIACISRSSMEGAWDNDHYIQIGTALMAAIRDATKGGGDNMAVDMANVNRILTSCSKFESLKEYRQTWAMTVHAELQMKK